MRRNLEFKAQVGVLESLERVFGENGARFVGVLTQRDTYFNVREGRLKLRETAGKKGELIFYRRAESSSASMESNYDIAPVADGSTRDLLAAALGIKTVVEKTRRLLMLRNARIHLDDVKGLGNFLEFEVVSGGESGGEGDDVADAALLSTLKSYAAPYVVSEINESYSDMMLRRNLPVK